MGKYRPVSCGPRWQRSTHFGATQSTVVSSSPGGTQTESLQETQEANLASGKKTHIHWPSSSFDWFQIPSRFRGYLGASEYQRNQDTRGLMGRQKPDQGPKTSILGADAQFSEQLSFQHRKKPIELAAAPPSLRRQIQGLRHRA